MRLCEAVLVFVLGGMGLCGYGSESLQRITPKTFKPLRDLHVLRHVRLFAVDHSELEIGALKLTVHLAGFGETYVYASNIVGCNTTADESGIAVFVQFIGVVDIVCAKCSTMNKLAFLGVVDTSFKCGAERAEVAESYAISEFKLLYNNLFERDEYGLNVDCC